MPLVLQSILGLVVSRVAVQLGLASTLLALPVLRDALAQVGHAVAVLQLATEAGTSLVFGYLGGVGILIGGFVALAPEPRADIVALGFKSLVAGTIATCATGAVIGILHGAVQG